jgi:hypothetical protein
VVPLFERGLAVMADEASGDFGSDWPKRVWIVDIRDETNPVIISTLPTPDDFDFPQTPDGQRGCRINDVFVDDRGIVYAGDRANGGL